MKFKLTLFFAVIVFFSCSENPNKKTAVESFLETDNSFLDISDSAEKTENLTHFQYQNKTVWGAIEVWYLDTEIAKIRARQRGEVGFIETTHFYEEGSNNKSIEIKHLANWQEFKEKFGDVDVFEDDRMTFTDDTTKTVFNKPVLDSFDLKMIHEASEIYIFIMNENKLMP